MSKKGERTGPVDMSGILRPEVAVNRADKLAVEIKALQAQLRRKPRDKGLQALLKATERRLAWYERRIPSRRPKRPRLSDIALGRVSS